MSSIIAHTCSSVIVCKALKVNLPSKKKKILTILAISLALLPDIDVLIAIFFKDSIIISHRGITHSLLFAFVASAILALLTKKNFQIGNIRLYSIFFLSILSHLILDFLMGAGPPVTFLAPFSYNGFLSPIKLVPSAFYSKSFSGLFQVLFYPPAIIGYLFEILLFFPIIILVGEKKSKFISAVLVIVFIFAGISTYQIYN